MSRDNRSAAPVFTPPADDEAECIVLGCVLHKSAACDLPALSPSMFFHSRNVAIAHAICELRDRNEPVDPYTVARVLLDRKILEPAGGAARLMELADEVGTVTVFGHWLARLRDLATRRAVMDAGIAIAQAATEADDAESAIETAQSAVLALAKPGTGGGLRHVSHAIELAMAGIERRIRGERTTSSTGLRALDAQIGGFAAGELVIVGADTGMGKSAFMTVLADAAADRGAIVAEFALEMPAENIGQRRLALRSRVPLPRVRNAAPDGEELRRLVGAAAEYHPLAVYVDDRPAVTLAYIATGLRKLALSVGPVALVTVDYVQLMSAPDKKGQRRDEQVAAITRGLKVLAKELGCTIIAASQINRDAMKRDDKRPRKSDLRESGTIEQDADMILLVYREGEYNAECDDPNAAEIIIAKQRNGPTGTVNLRFDGPTARFYDPADSAPVVRRGAQGGYGDVH